MKVCFVTQGFVRYPGDPIGSFVFRLAEEVVAQGNSVTVVAPHARGLASHEDISHTHVERFHYAQRDHERLAYTGTMQRMVERSALNKLLVVGFVASAIITTVRTIRRQKSDVIHAHWWFPSGVVGAIASMVTGVPLVVTCHGTDVSLLSRHPVVRSVARWVFRRSTAVTAVSDDLKNKLISHLPQLGDRVAVIPMPIAAAFTSPAARRVANDTSQRTIIAVARLSAQKGLDDLILACHILAQRGLGLNLLLCGEGDDEPRLRSLVQDLHMQERVTFLGWRNSGELAAYYCACDVAVLPSYEEGLGLSLVEAMFCGAPVVGTNVGGISDLIADGETGLLVPPANPEALAGAIERILGDHLYAERLGKAGEVHVRRNYDPDRCVRAMLAVYESVQAKHAVLEPAHVR